MPNSSVTSNTIVNVSAEENRRLDFTFTASADCAEDAVIAAITEAAQIDLLIPEEPVFVKLSGFKDGAVEYTLRVWVKNADYWDANFAVLDRIHGCYAAHGVAMTYPHINVHAGK